jgi:hypothetical protein
LHEIVPRRVVWLEEAERLSGIRRVVSPADEIESGSDAAPRMLWGDPADALRAQTSKHIREPRFKRAGSLDKKRLPGKKRRDHIAAETSAAQGSAQAIAAGPLIVRPASD